jgi:CRP/FNR family transcriptional regulator, cyclic AMP receptor protein
MSPANKDPLVEGSRTPRHACSVCASRKVCLIGSLAEPHLGAIAPLVREVSFKNHDVLLNEGEVTDYVKVVKLGTVMCSRRGPDGEQRPVALFGRGHVLGKYALVNHPNALSAVGLSVGRLCLLRVSELREGQLVLPALLSGVHGIMVRAFGGLADWSQVMRQRGLQRQLHASLQLLSQEQGHRVVRVPSHVALAALLSTTRESVARTMGQLEDAQLVLRVDRWHREVIAPFPEPSAGLLDKG